MVENNNQTENKSETETLTQSADHRLFVPVRAALFFFKINFLKDTSPFCGATNIYLFWTSGNVSSGLQSQSGSPAICASQGCTLFFLKK